jgi:hypothetical protein
VRFVGLLDTECCPLICSLRWILVRVVLRRMLTLGGRRVSRGCKAWAGTLRFVVPAYPGPKPIRERMDLFSAGLKSSSPLLKQGAPTSFRPSLVTRRLAPSR